MPARSASQLLITGVYAQVPARAERSDTAETGVVLIDQFDFPQQTDSLVLANYESDQDIAGISDDASRLCDVVDYANRR
jgi:hypothetical protein